MNNLEIKLVCTKYDNIVCLIDGDRVFFNKNEFNNNVFKLETTKENVEIEVFNYLELESNSSFLPHVLFFFVSIFGLFNPKYDKDCIKTSLKFTIDLKENTIVKIANVLNSNDPNAFNINTDSNVLIKENKKEIDKTAKRRYLILKFLKIVSWVSIIILIILIIIGGVI